MKVFYPSGILKEMTRADPKTPRSFRLERRFSRPGEDPLETVAMGSFHSVLKDSKGKVLFQMNGVEAPLAWSSLAVDILASKYFRRAGVPGLGYETSLKQVIRRIVGALVNEGLRTGLLDPVSAPIFEGELSFLLVHQMAAFNSPVWFNLGLFEAYGITGTGGNFALARGGDEIEEVPQAYERPQCSACFIQSIDDDLMSIFGLLKNEAKVFKYGSGTGTNFSKLRARTEMLSGGGTSSGLLSFLEVFDKAAGATKSGGITRRAAKMVCLDDDHPELLEFIEWKAREEGKARALIDAGYEADFNGEAYRSISGQNSNNSVRITDAFMNAVLQDHEWRLRARTSGEVVTRLPARKIWREIAKASWTCADPGLQFDSTIQKWHTCSGTDRIRASNPCSEFMFLDDTACNLASLNLLKFLDDQGQFQVASFSHAVRVLILAQELLVGLSSYPTEKIARNSNTFRPLGLGYANLGALLMRKGLPYDSEEGRGLAATITALLTGEAYAVSAELAAQMGAFSGYTINQRSMLGVIEQHRQALTRLLEWKGARLENEGLFQAAARAWDRAATEGAIHGFRNAQVTVLAPTGTIGLLMDCDTTGVEPDFSLVKFKKLAGGGLLKLVNHSVPAALQTLGYTPAEAKEILAHVERHQQIQGAPGLKEEHLPVFDCAQPSGTGGDRFIAPAGHLRMMAAIQPFLSGAISKTVNLPSEVTVEEIESLHWMAWELGLKSVAVYRDGCKASQPLSRAEVQEGGRRTSPLRRTLPARRQGITLEAHLGGQKIYLRTGEYPDGSLGEIFIDLKDGPPEVKALLTSFAVSVSLGLQYGVPLHEWVDRFSFTQFGPGGVVSDHPHLRMATSVLDYVFRTLGVEYLGRTELAHIERGQRIKRASWGVEEDDSVQDPLDVQLRQISIDAPPCDACGHATLRSGACFKCLHCGNSMGCS